MCCCCLCYLNTAKSIWKYHRRTPIHVLLFFPSRIIRLKTEKVMPPYHVPSSIPFSHPPPHCRRSPFFFPPSVVRYSSLPKRPLFRQREVWNAATALFSHSSTVRSHGYRFLSGNAHRPSEEWEGHTTTAYTVGTTALPLSSTTPTPSWEPHSPHAPSCRHGEETCSVRTSAVSPVPLHAATLPSLLPSIPQGAQELYAALVRIAVSASEHHRWKEHLEDSARRTKKEEEIPSSSSLEPSTAIALPLPKVNLSTDARQKLHKAQEKKTFAPHSLAYPSAASFSTRQASETAVAEGKACIPLESTVRGTPLPSSPTPKDLLQRLLLQHRQKTSARHSSSAPWRGEGQETSRSSPWHSIRQGEKVVPHHAPLEGGDTPRETVVETVPAKDVLHATATSTDDHTTPWKPPSWSMSADDLPGHPLPTSSARTAFMVFTEAVCQHGVTPSTSHFNVLLALAMAEMDWKLVDRIEQLHIGLLSAISERQDRLDQLLFADEKESPYSQGVLFGGGGRGAYRPRLFEEATRVDGPIQHASLPSSPMPLSGVTVLPPTIATSTPSEPFSAFPSSSSSLSDLRASLFDMETAMAPNASTLEWLMDAHRCRAEKMSFHHSPPVSGRSSCFSAVGKPSVRTTEVWAAPRSHPTIREGAAWAVLDILEVWQSTGVGLTERGVWLAMEALDRVRRGPASAASFSTLANDEERMWALLQEAQDGSGMRRKVAMPSRHRSEGPPFACQTLREVRACDAREKKESQRHAIRQEAIAEGLVWDRVGSSDAPSSSSSTGGLEWDDGKDERPLWKVAYALFSSFYAQPHGERIAAMEASSRFAWGSGMTRAWTEEVVPCHLRPFLLLLHGVTAVPSSPFAVPEHALEAARRQTALLPMGSWGPPARGNHSDAPHPHPPLSFLALYHLLRILHEAEQYTFMLHAYGAYVARVAAVDGPSCHARVEREALPRFRWEAVNVFPEPTAVSRETTREDGMGRVGYTHKGWEVWGLVMEAARHCGDWKVSSHVWEAASTQAALAATSLYSREPHASFSSASTAFPLSSSAVWLPLQAVPQWMRRYLPLYWQWHLHTLRRVGRYTSLLQAYHQLAHETGAGEREDDSLLQSSSTRSSEWLASWIWTPHALLLVAQAAVATQDVPLLLSLCGIGMSAPPRPSAAQPVVVHPWPSSRPLPYSFLAQTSPIIAWHSLWGNPHGNSSPFWAHHAVSPSTEGSAPHARPTCVHGGRAAADGLASAKRLPLEGFAWTIAVLHRRVMAQRARARSAALTAMVDDDHRHPHEAAIAETERQMYDTYTAFLQSHAACGSDDRHAGTAEAEADPYRFVRSMLSSYHRLRRLVEALDHWWNARAEPAKHSLRPPRPSMEDRLFRTAEAVQAVLQAVQRTTHAMQEAPSSEDSLLLARAILCEVLYRCRALVLLLSPCRCTPSHDAHSPLSSCRWPPTGRMAVAAPFLPVWRGERAADHGSPDSPRASPPIHDDTHSPLHRLLRQIDNEVSWQLAQCITVTRPFASDRDPRTSPLSSGETTITGVSSPSPKACVPSSFSMRIPTVSWKVACRALLLSSPSCRGHAEVVIAAVEDAQRYPLWTSFEVQQWYHVARDVAAAHVQEDYLSSLPWEEEAKASAGPTACGVPVSSTAPASSTRMASAREVLWTIARVHSHVSFTPLLEAHPLPSPSEKVLLSLANRLLGALREEVLRGTSHPSSSFHAADTTTSSPPPLLLHASTSLFAPLHPTEPPVVPPHSAAAALFPRFLHALRDVIRVLPSPPLSPTPEGTFLHTLLPRTVLHSVLELLSLHAVLRQCYWSFCQRLLLEFLPFPPSPPARQAHAARLASPPLWRAPAASPFPFSGLYAEEDTLRCVRRFLRGSEKNGTPVAFIQWIVQDWVGIVEEGEDKKKICVAQGDRHKHVGTPSPRALAPSPPEGVEQQPSMGVDTCVEFILEVLVWCGRHRAVGKPLLLSCMPWFQRVLAAEEGGQGHHPCERPWANPSRMTASFTSTAVIVCQALSSGRHEDVLRQGWPVLEHILSNFLYPQMVRRARGRGNTTEWGPWGGGGGGDASHSKSTVVPSPTRASPDVVPLDSIVAVMVKLQQTLHYLTLQIPLDLLSGVATGTPSSTDPSPISTSSRLLWDVLSPAVSSFLTIAERFMNVALLWDPSTRQASGMPARYVSHHSTSPLRFLSILRKLLDCQWDLLYASFVQRQVLQCLAHDKHTTWEGENESPLPRPGRSFFSSPEAHEACQNPPHRGMEGATAVRMNPTPTPVFMPFFMSFADLRPRLRRLLSLEHYYFLSSLFLPMPSEAVSRRPAFASRPANDSAALFRLHVQQWCTMVVYGMSSADAASADEDTTTTDPSTAAARIAAALASDVVSISVTEPMEWSMVWSMAATERDLQSRSPSRHASMYQKTEKQEKEKKIQGEEEGRNSTEDSSAVVVIRHGKTAPLWSSAKGPLSRMAAAVRMSPDASSSSSSFSVLSLFLSLVELFTTHWMEREAPPLRNVRTSTEASTITTAESDGKPLVVPPPKGPFFFPATMPFGKPDPRVLLELFASPPSMWAWMCSIQCTLQEASGEKGWRNVLWLSALQEAGAHVLAVLLPEVPMPDDTTTEVRMGAVLPPSHGGRLPTSSLSSSFFSRDLAGVGGVHAICFSPFYAVQRALAWNAPAPVWTRLLDSAAQMLRCFPPPLSSSSPPRSFSTTRSTPHFSPPDLLERLVCLVLRECITQHTQWGNTHGGMVSWQRSSVFHLCRVWCTRMDHHHSFSHDAGKNTCDASANAWLSFPSSLGLSPTDTVRALRKEKVVRLLFTALSFGYLDALRNAKGNDMATSGDGESTNPKEKAIDDDKQAVKVFLWKLLADFPAVAGTSLREEFFSPPATVSSPSFPTPPPPEAPLSPTPFQYVSSLDDPSCPAAAAAAAAVTVLARRKKSITCFFEDVIVSHARTERRRREQLSASQKRTDEGPPLSLVHHAVAWLLLCQATDDSPAAPDGSSSTFVPSLSAEHLFHLVSADMSSMDDRTLPDEALFLRWMHVPPSFSERRTHVQDSVLPPAGGKGKRQTGGAKSELPVKGEERTCALPPALLRWLSPPLLTTSTAKEVLERASLLAPLSTTPASGTVTSPSSSGGKCSPLSFTAPVLRQLLQLATCSSTSLSSSSLAFVASFSFPSRPGLADHGCVKDFSPTPPSLTQKNETRGRHEGMAVGCDSPPQGTTKELHPSTGYASSSSQWKETEEDVQGYCVRWLKRLAYGIQSVEAREVLHAFTVETRRPPHTPVDVDASLLSFLLAFPASPPTSTCGVIPSAVNRPLATRDTEEGHDLSVRSSCPVRPSPLDSCSSWSEVLQHLQAHLLPLLLPASPFVGIQENPERLSRSICHASFSFVSLDAVCRSLLTTLQHVHHHIAVGYTKHSGASSADERLAMVASLLILLECIPSPLPSRSLSFSSSSCAGSCLCFFLQRALLPWLYATRQDCSRAALDAFQGNMGAMGVSPSFSLTGGFSTSEASDGSFLVFPLPSRSFSTSQDAKRVDEAHATRDAMRGSNRKEEVSAVRCTTAMHAPGNGPGHPKAIQNSRQGKNLDEKERRNALQCASFSRWLLFLSSLMTHVFRPIHFFQWRGALTNTRAVWPIQDDGISHPTHASPLTVFPHEEALHDVRVALLRVVVFSLITAEAAVVTLTSGSTGGTDGVPPVRLSHWMVDVQRLRASVLQLWKHLQESFLLLTRQYSSSTLDRMGLPLPQITSPTSEKKGRTSFAFRGWLQCGILLQMWREMLSAGVGLKYIPLRPLWDVSTVWLPPRQSESAVPLEESEVRRRSLLLAMTLAKSMSRGALPPGLGRPPSSGRLPRTDGVRNAEKGTSCLPSAEDFCPSSRGAAASSDRRIRETVDVSGSSGSSLSCEAILPGPLRPLSQWMDHRFANTSTTSHCLFVTPARTIKRRKDLEATRGGEKRVIDPLKPSSFLSAVDRLCQSKPLHLVVQWMVEHSRTSMTSCHEKEVASTMCYEWLGSLLTRQDMERCVASLLPLCPSCPSHDDTQQTVFEKKTASTTTPGSPPVQEVKWEEAMHYLLHASSTEFAILRQQESSFAREKRNEQHTHRPRSGRESRENPTAESRGATSAIVQPEGSHYICVCWAKLCSSLSVIPPLRLHDLLLSLASGEGKEEEEEEKALSPSSFYPVPLLSTPPSIPHTVHFISPLWTTAAVAACRSWREHFFFLRTSLSTLVRSAGKATAVQHLMMQLLLERLREADSSFSRHLSSCRFHAVHAHNAGSNTSAAASIENPQEGERAEEEKEGRMRVTLPSILISSQPSSFLLSKVFLCTEEHPFRGAMAIVAYCYLYCCGNEGAPQKQSHESESGRTGTSPSSFLLPRLPQRLVIEMLRHSASSPPFCEALYQVFLRQRYRRLEGIHPFLSLLRAAKESLRRACVPEAKPNGPSLFPHSTTVELHPKCVEVFALLLLSMDGYYYSLTGKCMLSSLFLSLKDLSKTKGGELNSRGFQECIVQLSRRLHWYMDETATSSSHPALPSTSSRCTLGFPRGFLPLFAGVTSISPSGQRAMWKAFVNVCRTIFSSGRSGMDRSVHTTPKESGTKRNQTQSRHTTRVGDTTSFSEDRGKKQQEAPKDTVSDDVLLLGIVLIPKIVSYFRQDGWVSDVEELMVTVFIPHREKE